MGRKAMDPDRFQMRDLKRRVKTLEDQKDYMKADLRRWMVRVMEIEKIIEDTELDQWEKRGTPKSVR